MSQEPTGTFLTKLNKKKNIFILSGVLFFVIQSLYFVLHYRINFPYTVDSIATNFAINYLQSGEFSIEQLLQPHLLHHVFFPRLIASPNLIFNSFDVGNFFVFQWILFSLAFFLIYLILKKTQPNLMWLLVPISAFIYSPLQSSNYWAFAIWLWLIPPVCILAVIYLLSFSKINSKIMALALTLSIISTFSSLIGIVVWIPGLIILLKNKYSKKWIGVWIFSLTIIGSIYYTSIADNEPTVTPGLLFTPEGYSFIATFFAVAYRLKFDILTDIVGTFSIILSGILLWYFIKIKKNIHSVFPWFVFILVGGLSAIITGLGRVHTGVHFGNDPYYIPMSHFIQIGMIVLISIIILDLKNSKKLNQKFLTGVLFSIIIVFSLLLVPSYYAGWNRGEIYFNEKTEFIECFTLSSNTQCLQDGGTFSKNDYNFDNINYLLENNLSIFGEENFNELYINELNNFNSKIDYFELFHANGKIDHINGNPIQENKKIEILQPIVILDGWISSDNNEQLDEIYLMLDSKPFLKSTQFYEKNSKQLSSDKIKISFLAGYVENGCHDLTIFGIKNEKLFALTESYQICR